MTPDGKRWTKPMDVRNAGEALSALCRGLVHETIPADCWTSVGAEDLPFAFRELLVHNEHMTTRLEAFHGSPVLLRVLAYGLDGDVYRRKIILTTEDCKYAVEFGLVRIDLSLVPESVRGEIVDRKTPLGDILICHALLRRIVPRWYLRFTTDCPMFQGVFEPQPASLCGRIGTIYCDGQPAIKLLEVVTDHRSVPHA